MIGSLILAVAYATGVELRRVVLLAGAIHLPWLVAGLVLFHWYRARNHDDNRPSLFCEGVAAELRAGGNLRDALATAASSVGCRPFPAEAGMADVAEGIAENFPAIGDEVRLTVIAAARTGSDPAGLFDEIGSLALAQSEVAREVRVATAPGKATALVLVGAPVIYLLNQLGSGGIAELLATSEQRVAAIAGLGLFLLGLAVAGLIIWRASQ